MSLFDKLSKNTSEPASFEDPQKRRLAHLRARLPNFSMFMDSRKVSEEYAIFLMQKLDDCREEIRKGIHELELKVEANKLGLNEPLPSVDSFIAEIERIIQEKTS